MYGVSAAVNGFHELPLSQLRRGAHTIPRLLCNRDLVPAIMAMSANQAVTRSFQLAHLFREDCGIFQGNCSDFLGHPIAGLTHAEGNFTRPFRDPARAIALAMAIAFVNSSDPLKDGAVLILDNFVEPLPEKVVIHWHKPISKIHARILPQYGQALVSFRPDGLSSTACFRDNIHILQFVR
jgi:hypothetical protein